jgi:ornithine cyclodeaminase/alanine dehydrogenase-like protein (mu-crystallin family)
MLRLTEDDVRRLLPMRDAIDRLRAVFTDYAEDRAQNQPRRRLVLPTGAVLHQLAGAWGGYFGAKIYSTHVKHGATFTVLLYEAETGRLLAEIEANWLGQIRTGAVSGLAADCLLGKSEPVEVGCIGSGFQARSQVDAVRAVRRVSRIRVFSRNPEKRAAFAAEVGGEPVGSPEEAARDARVLITATWARDPVIAADAVRPGTLVLAMGSNQPQRRELPPELVRQNVVVVEDREACRIEAGDLLLAFEEADWERTIQLRDVVAGKAKTEPGRTVVFKSVGLGLEDIGAGSLVYERAVDRYS